MKAGTLKQFLLKKYPTNEYFDCPVPKHHWEVIQEYADDYARIQIEKDRENSKLLLKQHLQTHVAGYTPCCIEVFKNRPITLD